MWYNRDIHNHYLMEFSLAYQAYKFRLKPNKNQVREFNSYLETLRQVYNTCLGYWRDLYDVEHKYPSRNEVNKKIATIRKLQQVAIKSGESGAFWLARVSAVAVRDICSRVRKSYERFFAIKRGDIIIAKPKKPRKDGKPAGYPRFKSYGRLTSIPFDSYSSPKGVSGGSGCDLHHKDGRRVASDAARSKCGYHLKVKYVGNVRCVIHRDVVGKIKTTCIERDVDGKWYVIITTQVPDAVVDPKDGPAVGVDVGLKHFLTTSDGEHRPNPRLLKVKLKSLRRLQRSVSRKGEVAKAKKKKWRECRNLQKSQMKVNRLHVRVRNQRKEQHHQEANHLIRKAGTVCVEKLNVRGMLRNGKLARAIQDAAWRGFLNVLKLKAARAGVRFVEVDARGTSQTCPKCDGEVRKESLSERTHNCTHCGYVTDRDTAAAQVILKRGLTLNTAGHVVVAHKAGSSRPVQRNHLVAGVGRNTTREGVPKPVAGKPKKPTRSRKVIQPSLWPEDTVEAVTTESGG